MPTDAEFLTWNRSVIDEFRANAGVVEDPPFPILLLTTTGARTGRRTTTPLAYGVDGGRVFVVASKAGGHAHPAWFHNVQANADVTAELGTGSYPARAVVVGGAERDRLYELISMRVPTLRDFEKVTDRVFPVVVLDGVPAPEEAG